MAERRVGLGRGLAALLPPVEGFDPAGPETDLEQEAVSTFGAELVAELAADRSGLALLYRTLDSLIERFELRDAVVVIDEPPLGRQLYRGRRRPIDDAETGLLEAAPGLYTEPEIDDPAFDASLIFGICRLAVRLDLLRYDAWHDPLTGLYDRRSFDRLLEMAVARSRRHHWPFTLVIVDLDDFKALNDRDGHAAGDAALRLLADRFRRVLRADDNAARIGGDEFALILPNTPPEAVPGLLERLHKEDGAVERLHFSYGMASCPAEAEDFDALFGLADQRLYEQKERRRAQRLADAEERS